MFRFLLKAKIHQATVTDANLEYMGSFTIDRALMDAAGILPNERVQIVNLNNGERFETYAIEGECESGEICANGGAARLVSPGDKILILTYALVEEKDLAKFKPTVLFLDEKNRLIEPKASD